MADTEISNLPPVVLPASTDELAMAQGGVSYKVTRAQLHALQTGEFLSLQAGNDPSNPELRFGNGLQGLYQTVGGFLAFAQGGGQVAQLETAANGGMLVNNQATGGGLERVLTVSDAATFGEYAGEFDASSGSFPSGATAQDWYNCTVAGTIDSQSFVVGDIIIAVIDNPSTSVFAGNWSIVPHISSSLPSGSANGDMLYWDNVGSQYLSTTLFRWDEANEALLFTNLQIHGNEAGSGEAIIKNGAGLDLVRFIDSDGGVIVVDQAFLRIAAGNTLAIWGSGGDRCQINVDASGFLDFNEDNAIEGAKFQYPISILREASPPTAQSGFAQVFGLGSAGADANMFTQNDSGRTFPVGNFRERSYRFNNPTAAADPGSTFMRADTDDLSTITELYFDDLDYTGEDAGWWFNMANVNDIILIHQGSDEDRWLHARIDSITDNTGWWTVGVTPIAFGGSGAASVFQNGQGVVIGLLRNSVANRRAYGSMFDQENTDVFAITAQDEVTSYHTNGLAAGDVDEWTFDAGGAGTSVAISSVADGAASGVDIAVTTGAVHNLAIGDVISQSGMTDAAYNGIFVVKDIISTTIYEVEAPFTATDTGTMDQAATLTAGAEAEGEYIIQWAASASSVTSNQNWDFFAYNGDTVVQGSQVRRRFGTGGDVGSMSGISTPISIAAGDKISFAVNNLDGVGNITVRNLTMSITKVV